MAAELVVSMNDPTPPYEQLRRQLEGLIGDGTLKVGDRLPTLRQLAGDLGLAVGTVARTYRELESGGLIRSRRGGGTRVARVAAPPASTRDVESLAWRELSTTVARVLAIGAGPGQIRRLVDEALSSASTATIAAAEKPEHGVPGLLPPSAHATTDDHRSAVDQTGSAASSRHGTPTASTANIQSQAGPVQQPRPSRATLETSEQI